MADSGQKKETSAVKAFAGGVAGMTVGSIIGGTIGGAIAGPPGIMGGAKIGAGFGKIAGVALSVEDDKKGHTFVAGC